MDTGRKTIGTVNSSDRTLVKKSTGCGPGLAEPDVKKSREAYGSNELTRKKRKSFFAQFISNLGDPIIRILLIALAVNIVFMIGDINWFETGGIAFAILLATLVSTISEYGSGLAFDRLAKESENSVSKVLRDGRLLELSPNEIVVGDVVFLEPGDIIPADGVICRGDGVTVNQAALSGESKEASKRPDFPLLAEIVRKGDAAAAEFVSWTLDQSSLMFRGSSVCSGEGEMKVLRVGDDTFYGNVAAKLQEQVRPSPLKHRLSVLASGISFFGYVAAAMIAFAYLFNVFAIDSGMNWNIMLTRMSDFRYVVSELLHALTLAVSVIVVAVPEGLPMMITVVLSSNMKRMLKDNVLVRKLVGIETAGSLSILFTDKTGTLTTGQLSVGVVIKGDGTEYTNAGKLQNDSALFNYLNLTSRYNSASSVTMSDDGTTSDDGQTYRAIGGNATDRALLDYILSSGGSDTFGVSDVAEYDVIEKVPFDSSVKFSAVKIKAKKGERATVTLIKGAPELILPSVKKCIGNNGTIQKMSGSEMISLRNRWNELAEASYRVIAVAFDSGASSLMDLKRNAGGLKNRELTLVALIGIRDEVRKEAKSAVSQVREAGIRVIMITGDNEVTAASVAKECGILTSEAQSHDQKKVTKSILKPAKKSGKPGLSKNPNLILTGSDMAKLDDMELKNLLPNIAVIARALPSDKNRLVRVSQEMGFVVGMTGDGINDAPALTSSDVGFSMGGGTDVAKEAGDIVILDNNFASIAKAVLYGRTIFESIRKFIVFQLTMNFAALGVSLICPFIGIETPVTVAQMLWVNIIMDTLGGLAFAGEPPLSEYMKEPPKARDERILTSGMSKGIFFTGAYTVALCISLLKIDRISDFLAYSYDDTYLLTAFFGLFIFCGIFNCFNARTSRINLTAHLSGNKPFILIMLLISAVQIFLIYYGGTFFRTVPLEARDLAFVILLASTVVPFDIIRKMIVKMRRKKGSF